MLFRLLGTLTQSENPSLTVCYLSRAVELGSTESRLLLTKLEEINRSGPYPVTCERLRDVSTLVARLDPAYSYTYVQTQCSELLYPC